MASASVGFEDGALIDLVRQYPHLWDKANPSYKDIIAVENAWRTISSIMSYSEEDCKARWTAIRNRYAKERRIYRTTPSGSGAYRITWPYYKLCGFLESVIKPRRTKGNVSAVTRHQASEHPPGPSSCWDSVATIITANATSDLEETFTEENSQDGVLESPSQFEQSAESDRDSPELVRHPQSKQTPLRTQLKASQMQSPQSSEAENTLRNLRVERNVRNKGKKKEDQTLGALMDSVNGAANALENLVKNDIPTGILPEDWHFLLSVGYSLSAIKEKKQKMQLKAKLLTFIAEEVDD